MGFTHVQEEAAGADQLSLGWQQLHAGQDHVAVVARGQPGHVLWPPPPDGFAQHGRSQLWQLPAKGQLITSGCLLHMSPLPLMHLLNWLCADA